MKNLKIKLILACFILVLGSISLKAQAQEMVVIVNNANPAESMKQIEVKLHYMRKIKKRWSNSEAILPVQLVGKLDANQIFLAKVMKMSQTEVAGYFKQRQFSNGESLPEKFDNESELIDYVSENIGAIGYVSKSAYDSSSSRVKAILTL